MDEFITSTTTPKERLGSIRAIGECIGLVNRGCYLERNPGDGIVIEPTLKRPFALF